jgi:glycosyltransferase involved in cell wall biosynthesis
LRGWNVLHLHWTYGFWLPASRRIPLLHLVASAWFFLVLITARASGLRIAWTAHNVLPHLQVFHDDVAMERWLVRLSDVVIVHSPSAERELTRVVARPACLAVIPHPPFAVARTETERAVSGPLRLLFFGRVATYKGVEDLLGAMQRAGPDLRLTIAGVCDDPHLTQRIVEQARPLGEQVVLRLEHVPEDELPELLAEHDLLVLPFRRTTTSGSALLGLGAGIAVSVPDFSAFEDMPVLRFEPGVDGLTQFLQSLGDRDREELRRLGDAGAEWAASQLSWSDVGAATADALRGVA